MKDSKQRNVASMDEDYFEDEGQYDEWYNS